MKADLAEIVIILDRSGSMSKIRADMEGGLNTFFEEQKKEPGKCLVTLTQFDDTCEVVYSGKDLNDVPEAVLEPRGWTALLDAVGKTINEVGQRLERTPEDDRPSKVIFLIITDGLENSSKEYDLATIKKMIEHQRSVYNWEFVYIGANQDSFSQAAFMGIGKAQNYAADSVGTKGMISSATRGVSSYRGGRGYTWRARTLL